MLNKVNQKIGGFAALYQALAYIAAIVFFLVILQVTGMEDPMQKVQMIVAHQTGNYLLNLIAYVFFGIALVVLALALQERLQSASPALMKVATTLALIWAGLLIASGMIANIGILSIEGLYNTDASQAAMAWFSIDTVAGGLSGNGEILGGCWTLLVSLVGLRSKKLPTALNYLGLVIGGIGLISVIPALADFTALFGIGQIVWFIGLGVKLIKDSAAAA